MNYWLDIFSRYDIVNPNITSNVEFHNRYNIIIIPLLEQDQIIILNWYESQLLMKIMQSLGSNRPTSINIML